MPRIRITGISTPFGGASWELKDSEKNIAEQLIVFLEDKRVIKAGRYGHAAAITKPAKQFDNAVKSVIDIRHRLQADLEKARRDTPLFMAIRKMQEACRLFLSYTEQLKPGESYYEGLDALGRVIAHEMLQIAETLHFSYETEMDLGYEEDEIRRDYEENFFRLRNLIKLTPPNGDE